MKEQIQKKIREHLNEGFKPKVDIKKIDSKKWEAFRGKEKIAVIHKEGNGYIVKVDYDRKDYEYSDFKEAVSFVNQIT